MTQITSNVPFVDLSWQHQQIRHGLQSVMASVLDRGDFVMGQAVGDFEAAFANATGATYGIGVGSGTDAITLGLMACGIGKGDEVIMPTNTFVGTLVGIVRSGATPILVDCDSETALINMNAAEAAITAKTRAIVPVHLYGQMVSPQALFALAQEYNLIIFEDAAQAHLAEREGYRAGAVGAAAAFSFYPSKNLGAIGDGGMVLTQQKSIAQIAKSLRHYGSASKYVYQLEGGINSRLDTLQAAILNLKLPMLADWNKARNQLAKQYERCLAPLEEFGILPIKNESAGGHVYHLYVIRVTQDSPLSREELQRALKEQHIQTSVHYPIPCHLQPAFQRLGYQPGDFPQSEKLSQEILSLPMYPGMTLEQVDRIVSGINAIALNHRKHPNPSTIA